MSLGNNSKSSNNHYLQKGDLVHIIAPSSKFDKPMEDVKKHVESLGLKVYIDENIYKPGDSLYANTDECRAKDLINALMDDSKLVWCVRGGAGAIRLMPYLDENLPDELPQKLFVGYSDITALHSYLQDKYGWATIHGPMPGQIVAGFYEDDSDYPLMEKELLQLISNGIVTEEIDNSDIVIEKDSEGFARDIIFKELKKISNGIDIDKDGLSAKIVGGNLTLVESSICTDWQVDAEDKILFLEDVHEEGCQLERSLDHMKQAHMFDGTKGVIFGDFSEISKKDKKLVDFIEERFAESVDIPVFVIEGIGHSKVNHPLPLNTEAVITLSDEGDYTLKVNNVFYDYNI